MFKTELLITSSPTQTTKIMFDRKRFTLIDRRGVYHEGEHSFNKVEKVKVIVLNPREADEMAHFILANRKEV